MYCLGIHSGVRIGSTWTWSKCVCVCVCICGRVFKEYPCFYFVQNSKTRPEDNFKDKRDLLIIKMGRKYVLAHAQNYFLRCDLSLRDQGWGLWASHLRPLGFPFLTSYSECVGLSHKEGTSRFGLLYLIRIDSSPTQRHAL